MIALARHTHALLNHLIRHYVELRHDGETERLESRAADQVRIRLQPEDRESARPDGAGTMISLANTVIE